MDRTCVEKDLSVSVIKNESPMNHENNINLVKENNGFEKITKPDVILVSGNYAQIWPICEKKVPK